MNQYMFLGFSVWALQYGRQWMNGIDLVEDNLITSAFSWQEMCDIGYLEFDPETNSYRITAKAINYLEEHIKRSHGLFTNGHEQLRHGYMGERNEY